MLEAAAAARPDQAAGLRRIFRARGVRVLPILAPETDAARLLALASAIAATGERVLVIDEVANRLPDGIVAQATLADLVNGRVDFEAAATELSARVHWLAAAEGFDLLDAAGLSSARLYGAFGALPEPIDVVLVRVARLARLARRIDRDGECLLIAPASNAGLAAAYRHLKLAVQVCGSVRVLVDGATHARLAERIYARIAATAERFLGVVPRSAGWLPTESSSGPTSARSASARALESAASRATRRLANELGQWRLAEFPGLPASGDSDVLPRRP